MTQTTTYIRREKERGGKSFWVSLLDAPTVGHQFRQVKEKWAAGELRAGRAHVTPYPPNVRKPTPARCAASAADLTAKAVREPT